MGFLDRFKKQKEVTTNLQMVLDNGSGFFQFGNNIYKSDIVRSAIRPKARAIAKANPKHIAIINGKEEIDPYPYLKKLLKRPNPYNTWQQLIERLITQLELNNNAFAFIHRDDNGVPIGEYFINCASVQMMTNKEGEYFYQFMMQNGTIQTFNRGDVVHLLKDYNDNEFFGTPSTQALLPLMDVVSTTDQGIIQAIKSSNVIRWLLKFKTTTRPEDIKTNTEAFVNSFLKTDGNSTGAAGVDPSVDAVQVEPKNYVPNENQMNATTERILSFFNTNKKIIQSNYTENEWISFYESNCEPELKQLSEVHSYAILSTDQFNKGDYIYFDSGDLSYASMDTKLKLVGLVDRGIMSEEEMREIFKLGPKDSKHTFIRRLDTAEINAVSTESKGGE